MEKNDEPDLFEVCARIWCINRLFFIWLYPSTVGVAMLPVTLIVLVKPVLPLCLIAHVAFIAETVWRSPFILTSEVWSSFLDFSAVLCMGRKSEADRNTQMAECGTVVVAQLAILYFSTGFWKFNTSHLDSRSSCSTIMLLQVLDRLLPDIQIPLLLIRMAGYYAGHVGVFLETALGALLLLPGRGRMMAAVCAIKLHIFIVLADSPNNASVFGAKVVPRFFFVAPLGHAEVLKEILQVPSLQDLISHRAVLIVLLLALATYVGIQNGSGELGPTVTYDWAVPWSTVQLLALGRALWMDTRDGPQGSFSWKGFGKFHHWLVLACTLFYSFGTLILGVQEMGTNAGPFSNLRIHGGSNHILFPTGLLHQWSVGEFAGGVVRVDNTNSSFLRTLYPHEVSHNIKPRARAWMQAAGHSGREWIPLDSRTAVPYEPFSDMGKAHEPNFLPYTVPALELRRMLLDARSRKEAFSLTYSRLPIPESGRLDSLNSLTLVGEQVHFMMDACGTVMCVKQVGSVSEPCAPDELALLPAPSWWVRKTHVGYPIPLIGDSQEVPCAT